MTALRTETRITGEEYLGRERLAETKSEFLDGYIVAKSSGNRFHNLVNVEIGGAFHVQLRDAHYDVFMNNMRVKVSETGDYTYPDVVVACEPDFEDDVFDTLLTPTVIVEVLSPSNERNDRGRKFASYRLLPSLQEYLLVAQDHPSVEQYTRDGDRRLLTVHTDLDAVVRLPAIGCELRFAEIYRRVNFTDTGARPRRPGDAPH